MRIIAIGSKVFVTSFQMAGIEGIYVDSPMDAMSKINSIISKGSSNNNSNDVGLILISDDVAASIRKELTEFRAKNPIPLVFELPAPGSKKVQVNYRMLLKQILGI
jgi:V/A-type H+-transporting ATPase subunit F